MSTIVLSNKMKTISTNLKLILSGNGSSSQMMVFYFVVSAMVAFFLQYAIPSEARLYYSVGIIPVLVIAVLIVFWNKTYRTLLDRVWSNKREAVVTAVLAVFYSACLVFGAWAVGEEMFNPRLIGQYVAVPICALPLFSLLMLLWKYLDSRTKIKRDWGRLTFKWCALLFLGISVCWIPYLLAAWPGFSVHDTAVEWDKYVAGTQYSGDLWGHTVYMGALIELGILLFGSANAGAAFFTIIQAIILNAIFVFALTWMRRQGASRTLVYGSLAYYMLNPIIAACSMWAVKDVIYSALLILVCIFAFNVVATEKPDRKVAIQFVAFVVSAVILCLMRGNGRYVALLSFLVMIVISRAATRKMLIAAFGIVLVFNTLFLSHMNALQGENVPQDSTQSINVIFFVPVQQLAYVAYNGFLDEDEIRYLEERNYHVPEQYYENIADFTMKDISMSNADFIEAYIKIGLNHPAKYFSAFLKATQDAWNPYSYVDAYNANNSGYRNKETSFLAFYTASPAEADSKNPELYSYINNVGTNLVYQKIPGLGLLVSIPAYIWIVLAAMCRAAIVRDRGAASAMTLLCIASFTALLGPCILGRYFLYLFFGLPLTVFCLLHSQRSA